MRRLSAQEMMRAWEAGQGRSLAHRALLLLAYASPEASWEALAALPIGERDVRLLTLRESTFGRELSSLATCPACRERLRPVARPGPCPAAPQLDATLGVTC